MSIKNRIAVAYQVCAECGNKYGVCVAHCSSYWASKCDVCLKDTAVTESRDYNYLQKTRKVSIQQVFEEYFIKGN